MSVPFIDIGYVCVSYLLQHSNINWIGEHRCRSFQIRFKAFFKVLTHKPELTLLRCSSFLEYHAPFTCLQQARKNCIHMFSRSFRSRVKAVHP
jgi:hypothetical protein